MSTERIVDTRCAQRTRAHRLPADNEHEPLALRRIERNVRAHSRSSRRRQHVDEMQNAARRQMSGCGPDILENPIRAQMPKLLRPDYGSVTEIPRPPELNENGVTDLTMFRGSLSPRKQGREARGPRITPRGETASGPRSRAPLPSRRARTNASALANHPSTMTCTPF